MASPPCATDDARLFVTSLTFRAGDSRYAWLKTVFGVLEGVLDIVATGGLARGRAYRCNSTIASPKPSPV